MPVPLLIGTAIVGIGMQAYGMQQQKKAAEQANAAQQELIQSQQRQEALRMQAMELDARRRQREDLRNQQRARSVALSTATSQKANLGSGLQGAYGQISGTTGTDLLAINQNLMLGRQNFDLNSAMSQSKIGYANAQSQMQMGAALSSLGGSIVSNMGTIGNLSQGFGKPGQYSWFNYG